jgi:hypothetical protein
MMTGVPVVAGWIAQLLFWAVLGLGFYVEELRPRSVVVFVGLWLLGYLGLPHAGIVAGYLFTPYVAILDLVLVFTVFKGDVRLN